MLERIRNIIALYWHKRTQEVNKVYLELAEPDVDPAGRKREMAMTAFWAIVLIGLALLWRFLS